MSKSASHHNNPLPAVAHCVTMFHHHELHSGRSSDLHRKDSPISMPVVDQSDQGENIDDGSLPVRPRQNGPSNTKSGTASTDRQSLFVCNLRRIRSLSPFRHRPRSTTVPDPNNRDSKSKFQARRQFSVGFQRNVQLCAWLTR